MPSPSGPLAVEVENLSKHFSVPGATSRGALNRVLHPVQRGSRRTLRVLDRISFDVRQGELFGIVGRNGSGKSTLLRILGSIYRADAGRVRITGTLAPFIELGVGFQPQMSARQNVALNGVLLGLGRRDVRRRVDEVLDYAELEEFADVQLKNFSSGMKVRLAFASMLQADPDIYLVDEILAVGDEAFRDKCAGEFAALKKRGKTILMVTHRAGVIERLGDRAMLLRRGRIEMLGEPADVLEAYRAERPEKEERAQTEPQAGSNAKPEREPGAEPQAGRPEPEAAKPARGAGRRRAKITTLAIEGGAGEQPRLKRGEPLRVRVEADASGWVHGPTLKLSITDADGEQVFVTRDADRERLPVLKPGQRFAAGVTVDRPLAPGSYRLDCVLMHDAENRSGAVSAVRSLDFEVSRGPRPERRPGARRPQTKLELIG